ncbi:ATP-binding protein, partial [Streptomyces sp. NPDC059477]|uniref:ATP-binding protein n=1 Tax=Streptomyces sp. NPDC059477 TaxID=3346847 RepID=UPI0036CE79E8
MDDIGVPDDGGGEERLVGRGVDLEAIDALLNAPGAGRAVLLQGEAGVGKTAVLDALARAAAAGGTRVLRAAGVEFEADVAFAGLNQIFFPLRDAVDSLEAAHRDALRVALGLGAGPPPDRLLVGNAALLLLHRAAADTPLLVVVDDLPWIDRASAAVLGFLGRRLTGSDIALLAAARSGDLTHEQDEGVGSPGAAGGVGGLPSAGPRGGRLAGPSRSRAARAEHLATRAERGGGVSAET